MKYVCLDYGRQRVGVAISILSIAEPLTILQNKGTFWDLLEQIVQDHQVDEIVIGLSDGEMAKETQQFADQVKTKFQLPVHFLDESYSSAAVHEDLVTSGMKQSKRQQPIDHFAAARVLQEFLDTHPSSVKK